RWLIFFMAEYGSMVAVSGIAILLFLGGWHTGLLWFDPAQQLYDWTGGQTWAWIFGNVINVVVFIVKCYLLVFVMMWVRWTLPRLRIDQVMMTCLKYFLPISCFLLLGVSVWQVGVAAWTPWLKYPMALACVGLFVTMVVKIVLTPSTLPVAGLSGMWNLPAAPKYDVVRKP